MSTTLNIVTDIAFNPASLQQLHEAAQADIAVITDQQEFLNALHTANILCAFRIPDDLLEAAPHLRWLQFPAAGTERLGPLGLLAPTSRVIVTSASGIHAIQISEYVLGSMLLFNRSWPEMVDMQRKHLWPPQAEKRHLRHRELAGHTLGIVGLGNIGRRIAQLARAFGMKVIATRFSAQTGAYDPDVDSLYAMDQLHELLKQSDYVVLSVPLTEQTDKLIGAAELHAMPSHAYLINIARGRVIDEPALIRALQEGWIAGAGLDVTVDEPLPADSPLFDAPNLILSPHISGLSEHYNERLADLFADNLRRYLASLPLRNQYSAQKGY